VIGERCFLPSEQAVGSGASSRPHQTSPHNRSVGPFSLLQFAGAREGSSIFCTPVASNVGVAPQRCAPEFHSLSWVALSIDIPAPGG